MDTADIVIAGGGIIGLSAALELRQCGFRVKVLERRRFMSEASWAAAGMLAAEDPENPPELAPLSHLSRQLYPEYLSRVERLSGHSVPLRTRGTLQTTRPNARFACETTSTRRSIDGAEAAERVPGLSVGSRSLLWLEEASIDPRDLCLALPAAAAAAGVVLEEEVEVLAVADAASSVEIATSAGKVSSGAFLNCCGAWAGMVTTSSAISGREIPAAAPAAAPAVIVEPRKGQMVTVREPGPPNLAHVLRTPDFYLVPRGDGRIVVGASLERAGFDRRVDSAVSDGLLAQAAALWPPIATAPVVDRWAGLRPGTSDDLPLIGLSEAPHCWVATGHFRNGILLAPATALVMRQAIEGRVPEIALECFSGKRLAPLEKAFRVASAGCGVSTGR